MSQDDVVTREQDLSRDLGIPDDLLVYGYSGTTRPGYPEYVESGDYVNAFRQFFKGMGLRNQTMGSPPPSYLGNQIFSSTTRPVPEYNYCRNQKLKLVCHPYGYWANDYRGGVTQGYIPYTRMQLPIGTAVPTAPAQIDWSESDFASNRAWWTMQPRFEGDFQALNFLFELKDFKNIAKGISALRPGEITNSLKRAKSMINKARRAVEKGNTLSKTLETARAGSRAAAEAILIKHFAIDPTIRDLTTLHAQLNNLVSDVQHRFRDKGLTENSRHYSETISEFDETVIGAKGYYWRASGTRVTDVFTATMSHSYTYKMRNHVDALKRYYGAELNAEVAWNAMPFTFLIDYFVKIGDAISAMRKDPNVMLTIHRYCESRLVTKRVGFSMVADPKLSACIINCREGRHGQLFTGYEGTLYERRVVPPRKGVALPRVKLPSVKQAINIAALVRCFL